MKRSRRAGVTLMELLIAMSLLSLLSLGVVMAMRVGLGAVEKANGRLQANRRAIGAQKVLEQQLAGLMPVGADCMGGIDGRTFRVRFFQGDPESMRFVSSYSLEEAGRGRPRILEFQVIPGEDGRGVRLIVNERLYTGPRSSGTTCSGPVQDPATGMSTIQFLPIQAGPQSFVLADRLAHCRFSYRQTVAPPEFERWLPRWTLPMWPSAIRVDMAPLDDDAAQIPPLAITAPVHVDKNPHVPYLDAQ